MTIYFYSSVLVHAIYKYSCATVVTYIFLCSYFTGDFSLSVKYVLISLIFENNYWISVLSCMSVQTACKTAKS